MTQEDQPLHSQQSVLSGSREAMEPLYEQLLQQTFPNSHSAVEFCRHACAQFGFTVKQEASANKNIYVYCSREGLPDSQRKPKATPQRKRPSKRCDCRWRVVLSENTNGQWEFRKSSNTTAYEHNHEMMDPKEMIKSWPAQVNLCIIQLARQRLQTHEIRDLIKQRFPDITWNERRFYNRLAEERKRIKQRDVVQRTQKLLLLSTQICSLVAANEDWFDEVESSLARFLDHYCYMARLVPSEGDLSLVDLSLDQITMDIDSYYHTIRLKAAAGVNDINSSILSPHQSSVVSDTSSTSLGNMELDEYIGAPTKKRKSMQSDQASTSTPSQSPSPPPSSQSMQSCQLQQRQRMVPKGTHIVYVPPLKLFVRPQRSRSLSESAQSSSSSSTHQSFLQQHRSSYTDSLSSPSTMMDVTSPHPHPHQTLSFNNASFYPLTSSNSSVTSTFQQPQQRTSQQSKRKQSMPSSSIATTASTAGPPTSMQQASSASPHNPFYMTSTSYHSHQNSPLGGNGLPLQQSSHTYPMSSFDQPYSNNSSNSSSNTMNSNDMALFDRSTMMNGGNMTASRQYNKMANRQELLDLSGHQTHPRPQHKRQQREPDMTHRNSQPFFMYPTEPPTTTITTTSNHILPSVTYDSNYNKEGLFETQRQQSSRLFPIDTYQSTKSEEGNSPIMDGVLLDNSSM